MLRKYLNIFLIIAFVVSSLGPIPKSYADNVLGLPTLGTMIALSPAYAPAMIKGLTVHRDNPFLFDFIVDVGQDKMEGKDLENEGQKLIKYFMAGLAIPEKDLWVNLSPYEKDRTIPEALSQTDMGRDLLAQDYILKQLTASLIYPEKELGKKFWDKVYAEAQAKFGTTEIPVNTFNKVWIMADRAEVFERNQTVFVTDSHLKVMLEEDYLALDKHEAGGSAVGARSTHPPVGAPEKIDEPLPLRSNSKPSDHALASQIIREIILPELEREVNEGKHFANLRQIFNSLILAGWYKNNLKEALLNQAYSDHSKVNGIDIDDKTIKEQIYQRYLQAYKKGVFNYIKEENSNGVATPKKYFSGGITRVAVVPKTTLDSGRIARALPLDRGMVTMKTRLTLDMPIKGSMADQSRRAVVDLVKAKQGDVDPKKDDRLKDIVSAYHLLNDRETEHFNPTFKWEENRSDILEASESRSRLYARYGATSSPLLIRGDGSDVPVKIPNPSYTAFHLFVFKDGSSIVYFVDQAMTAAESNYRSKVLGYKRAESLSQRGEMGDEARRLLFQDIRASLEDWVRELKSNGRSVDDAYKTILAALLETVGKDLGPLYLDQPQEEISIAIENVFGEDAVVHSQDLKDLLELDQDGLIRKDLARAINYQGIQRLNDIGPTMRMFKAWFEKVGDDVKRVVRPREEIIGEFRGKGYEAVIHALMVHGKSYRLVFLQKKGKTMMTLLGTDAAMTSEELIAAGVGQIFRTAFDRTRIDWWNDGRYAEFTMPNEMAKTVVGVISGTNEFMTASLGEDGETVRLSFARGDKMSLEYWRHEIFQMVMPLFPELLFTSADKVSVGREIEYLPAESGSSVEKEVLQPIVVETGESVYLVVPLQHSDVYLVSDLITGETKSIEFGKGADLGIMQHVNGKTVTFYHDVDMHIYDATVVKRDRDPLFNFYTLLLKGVQKADDHVGILNSVRIRTAEALRRQNKAKEDIIDEMGKVAAHSLEGQALLVELEEIRTVAGTVTAVDREQVLLKDPRKMPPFIAERFYALVDKLRQQTEPMLVVSTIMYPRSVYFRPAVDYLHDPIQLRAVGSPRSKIGSNLTLNALDFLEMMVMIGEDKGFGELARLVLSMNETLSVFSDADIMAYAQGVLDRQTKSLDVESTIQSALIEKDIQRRFIRYHQLIEEEALKQGASEARMLHTRITLLALFLGSNDEKYLRWDVNDLIPGEMGKPFSDFVQKIMRDPRGLRSSLTAFEMDPEWAGAALAMKRVLGMDGAMVSQKVTPQSFLDELGLRSRMESYIKRAVLLEAGYPYTDLFNVPFDSFAGTGTTQALIEKGYIVQSVTDRNWFKMKKGIEAIEREIKGDFPKSHRRILLILRQQAKVLALYQSRKVTLAEVMKLTVKQYRKYNNIHKGTVDALRLALAEQGMHLSGEPMITIHGQEFPAFYALKVFMDLRAGLNSGESRFNPVYRTIKLPDGPRSLGYSQILQAVVEERDEIIPSGELFIDVTEEYGHVVKLDAWLNEMIKEAGGPSAAMTSLAQAGWGAISMGLVVLTSTVAMTQAYLDKVSSLDPLTLTFSVLSVLIIAGGAVMLGSDPLANEADQYRSFVVNLRLASIQREDDEYLEILKSETRKFIGSLRRAGFSEDESLKYMNELAYDMHHIKGEINIDELKQLSVVIATSVKEIYENGDFDNSMGEDDAAMIADDRTRIGGEDILPRELLTIVANPKSAAKNETQDLVPAGYKLALSLPVNGPEQERVIRAIKAYVQSVISDPQSVFVDKTESGKRKLYVIAHHERLFLNSLGELKSIAEKALKDDAAMVSDIDPLIRSLIQEALIGRKKGEGLGPEDKRVLTDKIVGVAWTKIIRLVAQDMPTLLARSNVLRRVYFLVNRKNGALIDLKRFEESIDREFNTYFYEPDAIAGSVSGEQMRGLNIRIKRYQDELRTFLATDPLKAKVRPLMDARELVASLLISLVPKKQDLVLRDAMLKGTERILTSEQRQREARKIDELLIDIRAKKRILPGAQDDKMQTLDQIVKSDGAMSVFEAKPTNGGIDLDTATMGLKVRKEGNGVEMTVDPAMIERVKREGIESLTPVILNISPIVNIWPLFGLESPATVPLPV